MPILGKNALDDPALFTGGRNGVTLHAPLIVEGDITAASGFSFGGIGGEISGATPGSVLYVGAGGTLEQDTSGLFFDPVTGQLSFGTIASTTADPATASSASVFSAWGDSLTRGSGSTGDRLPYTNYLSLYLTMAPVAVNNFGVPAEVAAQVAARFLARPDTWNNYQIFWVGTNDVGANSIAGVVGYIQSMVAVLKEPKHYLVVGAIPYNSWTCATAEGLRLVDLNNQLAAAFPDNFFNMLTYLQSLTQHFIAGDAASVVQCLVPASFHSGVDPIHLSDAAYHYVAEGISEQVNAQLDSERNVVLSEASAPGIGAIALGITGIVNIPERNTWLAGTNLSGKLGTTGTYNYGIGDQLFQALTTGSHNIVFGLQESFATVGITTGSYNVLAGRNAGSYVGIGIGNIMFGASAGRAFGFSAAANGNVILGYQCCFNSLGGSGNIVFGTNIDTPSTTADGQLNIGAVLFGTGLYSNVNAVQGATPIATGNIGIGMNAPTARLHLAAGTATVNTAPFRLTSGINLTTAVAGVMEYNGTNLFFTRAGTTRESVVCANAVNVVSPTSPDRTITVVIDGTTYYIAAKTTNN